MKGESKSLFKEGNGANASSKNSANAAEASAEDRANAKRVFDTGFKAAGKFGFESAHLHGEEGHDSRGDEAKSGEDEKKRAKFALFKKKSKDREDEGGRHEDEKNHHARVRRSGINHVTIDSRRLHAGESRPFWDIAARRNGFGESESKDCSHDSTGADRVIGGPSGLVDVR